MSRKARQLLGELGAEVEERRYFDQLPGRDEIEKLAAMLPGGVMDIVSTRSRRFKELGLEGQNLSHDEWVDLLSREPGLWRRPIAVRGKRIVVGFDQEALEELVRAEGG